MAGPRVRPTITTAGDNAFAERRRQELLQRMLARQRTSRHQLVSWADAWIDAHGGTIPAALKATHPDHGGKAADFQRTLEARRILEEGL
jgi:hypothetical protein